MVFEIHPLAVAAALFYSAVMWWVTRGIEVRMDTRIFSVVLAGEGILYIVFWAIDIPIAARAVFVRTSLILIALSQAIPLHISYSRNKRR